MGGGCAVVGRIGRGGVWIGWDLWWAVEGEGPVVGGGVKLGVVGMGRGGVMVGSAGLGGVGVGFGGWRWEEGGVVVGGE